MLRVKGSQIVDEAGNKVILKGFGIGGWLNMENFITAFPSQETQMKQSMRKFMSSDAYEAFFDSFYKSFFNENDLEYLKSLGVNCVRVPFNYKHLEADAAPFEILDSGLELLDRVIDQCERAGVYIVLDLHAVPGYQNHHWHSDNPTHWPFFWEHRQFQDRVVHLWGVLAERYRGRPYIAGYNLLNEPADEAGDSLLPFYERAMAAVREYDSEHMIFLDANTYSTDFSIFGAPFENSVYATHDYALAGLDPTAEYPGVMNGSYPGSYAGQRCDKTTVEETFLRRCDYQLKHGVPLWIGEFGPVFTVQPERDKQRYALLRDQLHIYDKHQAGWSLWTYKDMGMQGLAVVDKQSAYGKLVADIIAKKHRLGADSWGGSDANIRQVMEPLEKLIAEEFPDFDPYPWGQKRWIARIMRHVLISEAMVDDFGKLFTGCTPETASELGNCFALESCQIRTELQEVIAESCH